MRVVIVGRGKVGTALAGALSRAAGIEVRAIAGRRLPRLVRADVVVLAVPDGAISTTCAELVDRLKAPTVILHCAGARNAAELRAAKLAGHCVAAWHPLVSFAGARASSTLLAGATFVTWGDARARRAAKRLTRALEGVVLEQALHGPGYHACAALAANGAAALIDAAVLGLVKQQVHRRSAERAVAHLVASVAANVADVGVARALTGPVVRGDVETVRAHLAAAHELELGETYALALRLIVASAKRAGLSASAAREMLHHASSPATAAGSRAGLLASGTATPPSRPPRSGPRSRTRAGRA